MPVILAPEAHVRWLDPKTDARGVLKLCPSAWLEAFPVDRRINSPGNDDPDCIPMVRWRTRFCFRVRHLSTGSLGTLDAPLLQVNDVFRSSRRVAIGGSLRQYQA
jgi:hypothetical protein